MSDSQRNDAESDLMRLRFPHDEGKFPWLSMLLDAYAIIDEGVAVAVKAEEDELNIKLACREGCDNCCRAQSDIPLYPLELIGVSWFAAEKVTGPQRATLKEQLTGHGEGDPCPFLLNGVPFILFAPSRAGSSMFSTSRAMRGKTRISPGGMMSLPRYRITRTVPSQLCSPSTASTGTPTKPWQSGTSLRPRPLTFSRSTGRIW